MYGLYSESRMDLRQPALPEAPEQDTQFVQRPQNGVMFEEDSEKYIQGKCSVAPDDHEHRICLRGRSSYKKQANAS